MTPETLVLRHARSDALLRDLFEYNASFLTSVLDFVFGSIDTGCQCARRLSKVDSPSQFEEALTDNLRDQFEALSDQVEELSMLMAPEREDTTLSFWD